MLAGWTGLPLRTPPFGGGTPAVRQRRRLGGIGGELRGLAVVVDRVLPHRPSAKELVMRSSAVSSASVSEVRMRRYLLTKTAAHPSTLLARTFHVLRLAGRWKPLAAAAPPPPCCRRLLAQAPPPPNVPFLNSCHNDHPPHKSASPRADEGAARTGLQRPGGASGGAAPAAAPPGRLPLRPGACAGNAGERGDHGECCSAAARVHGLQSGKPRDAAMLPRCIT